MEMDIFWVVKGGADPMAYLDRYPGRFPLVHIKGRDRNGDMTEVASDNSIGWKVLFAQFEKAGIQHYFVEHDEPTSAFDSIRRALTTCTS
jgi:sugar phosphate isomerase/epimerase